MTALSIVIPVYFNAENLPPLYRDLTRLAGVAPGWNFHKYLIARDGTVVAQFPSKVRPDDAELRAAIERELAKPAPHHH